LPHLIQPPLAASNDTEKLNFFRRSQSTLSFSGRLSCSVLASADTFLLELEKIPPLEIYAQIEDRDTMSFMEEIAKELRQCWSIEEMASLVCARVMSETPYDRGMVYKFDHEDCGEVVYETFRGDASVECRSESYLGLRFPASDIPRQGEFVLCIYSRIGQAL
jgi:light-regulated signal transduction histidine kinase (bacteriophytochrome)